MGLILTDVDETVLQFSDQFQNWMQHTKGIAVNDRLRHRYKVHDTFGVDRERALALLDEFTDSPEFGLLKAEICAGEVLPQLHASGYRLIAITACTDAPEVAERRAKNLTEVFGFAWDAVHCVGLRGSKAEVLASYPPAVWVEDNFFHAVVGAEIGHQTYLLDRHYNRDNEHPKVRRVNDWHDIIAELKT